MLRSDIEYLRLHHLIGDDMTTIRTCVAVAAMGLALFLGSCGGDEECVGACECRGAECVCPSSGDCAILCAADCDLQCAGSGNCDFECGDGCIADCTSSGLCQVDVGHASTVQCTGSGDCDIACHGDCTVRCPGSGDCIMRCEPDSTCNMEACSGEVTDCGGGISICGGTACPG